LEQFVGQWRRLLDQRGIEAFQDVWVRLERQYEESLNFPILFLSSFAFDLIGNAVERPVAFG
jgi:hypothetical protein